MTAPFDSGLIENSAQGWKMSKANSLQQQLEVAVMISGRGSNLAALLKAFDKDPQIRIVLVISNDTQAHGLKIAADFGVETLVIDHKNFSSRLEFDRAIDLALKKNRIELLCLAGFMRILSDEFVTAWQGRMINIHPSLLPAYRGLHTHERVLAAGESVSGCTVHFVSPEVDKGEIILQSSVEVMAGDNPDSLAARVLAAEHSLYPAAVRLVAQQKLATLGSDRRLLGNE